MYSCALAMAEQNLLKQFTGISLFELQMQPTVITSSVWQYFLYLGQEVKNTKTHLKLH